MIDEKGTYDDEIGSDKEKARGAKGAPGESTEQEGSSNAEDGEAREQKGSAEDEDDEVAKERRFPGGRGRLDQLNGTLKP